MKQNELVKEALEAQMAELKQSMNQAGVKVDAVEVTAVSYTHLPGISGMPEYKTLS